MTESTTGAAPAAARHGSIGVFGAAAIVMGSMVGSGVYLLPATMGAIGSISILGWLVATLAALAIAGVFVGLGRIVSDAEGLPGYVEAGLGRLAGVQSAVLYWTSLWVGTVAIAVAATGALGFLIPGLSSPSARLAVTVAVIWVAVALSWIGPRVVARTEALTLALGLLPVVLAATAGWWFFRADVFLASWNPTGQDLGEAVGASALNAFWAFLGMECAAATAGVVRDPTRNVPRATLLGVGGAAVLYISATTVMMGILPARELAASTAPFADVARATLGAALGAAIALCTFLRTAGGVTGWTLVMAETSRGAADQGLFWRAFRTRPGERTSPASLLGAGGLMTVVAVVTASPDLGQQFTTIINAVSLLCLYTYILAAGSLLRLSRRLSMRGRIAAVAVALLAIAFSLALIAQGKPVELGLSLLPVVAAGLLHARLRRG
ncbi:amino acid permease [Phenylobacterium kunshanense]|uniref:Arginine/agmatine antiporter n=1 Tax=Phenylobacterium kunshanense TaxID=1445034 RepID=A0A328B8Q1_9CAUL|nr:amino acid permease [Phenylobacterium kunshanense]RAK63732.1 amino acid permease [Phenylobacterium kunshanense]